jgi:acyl-CoA reductase-like NAD-dependent aldehyde dehydrogenase
MSELATNGHGSNGDIRIQYQRTEAERAVERARAAHEYWQLQPLDARIAAAMRAAKTMLRRRAEVMAIAHEEIGKVRAEALMNEALGPLDQVRAWGSVVTGATRRRHVRLNPLSFGGKKAFVDFVPRGVVGIIAPWNFPVAGLYRSVLPALLTGNGVVLKPSEYAPRSAAWFVDRLAEELPAGLVAVLPGDGRVGAQLIDAGIDACVFTGSPRTGRSVALRCAERGIPSSIEMGGKDAAIVLGDCDLARTVAGITHWSLSNAGQACGAIEVAYVDERIADAFVDAMRRAWTRLDRASVAPLAHRAQFDIVRSHVEDARAKGATVVCGGAPGGDDLWYPPTLIDRCHESMSVVTDETFGPVLAIVRVAGATDAIRAVNRGRYGLGASVWTEDLARGERLAARLEVGVTSVNNHSFTGAIPALPWSGTRETGFGVASSAYALSTFVRPRVLAIDTSKDPDPYWMPYDDDLVEFGEAVADAQLFKLENAWKIPLLLRRRLRAIRSFFSR